MGDNTPNMPASEVNRPWMPGPWGSEQEAAADAMNPAAILLIALAPEMAEAILAHDEQCPNCGGAGCLLFAELHGMAEKLRAIGATDA